MEKNKYLECGQIVGTHGVKGTLKLTSLCDSPYVLSSLKKVYLENHSVYQEYKVDHASVQKQMVLMSLSTVTTVENANLLRGRTVYALREDIPLKKGSFFLADLMGLPVIEDETGILCGHIAGIENPAGQQLYEVKKENGNTFLIPCVKEFILRVETEGEKAGVYVHLIEGMME